ncbi:hypothetical protein [Solibacillus sp. FSL W7-1324]|uniref:hypothetical protein n=1 Tax=Solibacillus sp. FSL W7-1324 TaxID=2921701 RepID=UPI0030F787F9
MDSVSDEFSGWRGVLTAENNFIRTFEWDIRKSCEDIRSSGAFIRKRVEMVAVSDEFSGWRWVLTA